LVVVLALVVNETEKRMSIPALCARLDLSAIGEQKEYMSESLFAPSY